MTDLRDLKQILRDINDPAQLSDIIDPAPHGIHVILLGRVEDIPDFVDVSLRPLLVHRSLTGEKFHESTLLLPRGLKWVWIERAAGLLCPLNINEPPTIYRKIPAITLRVANATMVSSLTT